MPTAAGPDGQSGQHHPWESQLRAARTRNEQTQVAWLPPEPEPDVAPPPYQAPAPAPTARPNGRAVSAAQARREAQVAPAPYRPAPPQPERRDPVADPAPAVRPAPAQPERRRDREPDRDRGYDRDREPEYRERAPRRPRRRMRIPGGGCLKFLLVLVVAGFLVWQFSPLHGWIDHGVRTVEGWWHAVVHEYHRITGTVNQVNKTVKNVKSINGG
jgi:serine/threonine-protein kinase